jgi:hypothetical protein
MPNFPWSQPWCFLRSCKQSGEGRLYAFPSIDIVYGSSVPQEPDLNRDQRERQAVC